MARTDIQENNSNGIIVKIDKKTEPAITRIDGVMKLLNNLRTKADNSIQNQRARNSSELKMAYESIINELKAVLRLVGIAHDRKGMWIIMNDSPLEGTPEASKILSNLNEITASYDYIKEHSELVNYLKYYLNYAKSNRYTEGIKVIAARIKEYNRKSDSGTGKALKDIGHLLESAEFKEVMYYREIISTINRLISMTDKALNGTIKDLKLLLKECKKARKKFSKNNMTNIASQLDSIYNENKEDLNAWKISLRRLINEREKSFTNEISDLLARISALESSFLNNDWTTQFYASQEGILSMVHDILTTYRTGISNLLEELNGEYDSYSADRRNKDDSYRNTIKEINNKTNNVTQLKENRKTKLTELETELKKMHNIVNNSLSDYSNKTTAEEQLDSLKMMDIEDISATYNSLRTRMSDEKEIADQIAKTEESINTLHEALKHELDELLVAKQKFRDSANDKIARLNKLIGTIYKGIIPVKR